MRQNVEFIRDWREKVGEDYPLMVDCYMALDVQYTVELCRRLEPYGVKWLEECLMPDDYAAHAKLAQRMDAMGTSAYFAKGEHEYSRWGYLQVCTQPSQILNDNVHRLCGAIRASRRR
jgi:L-rhamnonate dehydratase